MESILMLVAILFFSVQSLFLKRYSEKRPLTAQTLAEFCAVMGFTSFFLNLLLSGFRIPYSSSALILTAIFGLSFFATITFYNLSVKFGNFGVAAMFVQLGALNSSLVYGMAVLKEKPSLLTMAATVLVVLSFVPGVWSVAKGKQKPMFLLFCFLSFLFNGATSVITKIRAVKLPDFPETAFSALCALFCFVFAGVLAVLFYLKKGKTPKPLVQVTNGAGFAVCNSIAFLMMLILAGSVPASVLFPAVGGGIVVVSAGISILFLKEKLSASQWISLGLCTASFILFAFSV